jgi:hypothetical protein
MYFAEPYNGIFESVQKLDLSKVMARVKKHQPDLDHVEAEK